MGNVIKGFCPPTDEDGGSVDDSSDGGSSGISVSSLPYELRRVVRVFAEREPSSAHVAQLGHVRRLSTFEWGEVEGDLQAMGYPVPLRLGNVWHFRPQSWSQHELFGLYDRDQQTVDIVYIDRERNVARTVADPWW